jgi:hypothetical protein
MKTTPEADFLLRYQKAEKVLGTQLMRKLFGEVFLTSASATARERERLLGVQQMREVFEEHIL